MVLQFFILQKKYWNEVIKRYLSEYIGLTNDSIKKATDNEIEAGKSFITPTGLFW